MKIILQSIQTLKFISLPDLLVPNEWTPVIERARPFTTALEAMFYCYRNDIPNMQIRVMYPDQLEDYTIGLTNNHAE
jgi:hypothetical protein